MRLLVAQKASLLFVLFLCGVSYGDDQPKSTMEGADLAKPAKELKSTKPAERIKACVTLGNLGADARPMLRALCQAATDPNTRVRKSALFALEKIDKDLFDAAVRVVIEHGSAGKLGQEQKEGAEEVFENAVKWKRDSKDAKAMVPLIYCWWQYHLADRRASLAREEGIDTFDSSANAAIRALKEIVPDEKDTARAFTAWLMNDPNPTLRGLLAESIPGLAHEKDCVKSLALAGRQDADEKVRSAALAALRKISGKLAVKILVTSAQKDPNDEVRTTALELLGDLGTDAKEAAPIVHDLCLDPNPSIRTMAGAALKKITKDKP